ncbi:GNAT family N-acetyltransferase [Flavobacterium agricola]|uniref:GNAT family N-acetyltransferase n=1 Tax=Flavobacterium agricola TaxID=2870839 RepID=A0ABY6M0R6_9FLAO|nr:GNAT family N-acetyltransferase [Flavobacterium agricola]UYW02026.1 GNAT family N-acetyltransferase [Flavobacterium agricola]
MKIDVKANFCLELVTIQDAPAIFDIIATQKLYLGQWLPFIKHTNQVSDTENWIASLLQKPKEALEFTFAMKVNQQIIGLISLLRTDLANNKTEIGYWVSESFSGQGFTTLATQAICNYAFNTLHFNRITIKCGSLNFASQAIPKKLGFTFEGIERQAEQLQPNLFHDLHVFSLLKSEYQSITFNCD